MNRSFPRKKLSIEKQSFQYYLNDRLRLLQGNLEAIKQKSFKFKSIIFWRDELMENNRLINVQFRSDLIYDGQI